MKLTTDSCKQGRSTPFRGGRAGADTGFMKGGGGGGGGGGHYNWGERERAPHRRVQCEFSLFLYFYIYFYIYTRGNRTPGSRCNASP